MSTRILKLCEITINFTRKYLVHQRHTQCYSDVSDYQHRDHHLATARFIPRVIVVDTVVRWFLRCLFKGKFLWLAHSVDHFITFSALFKPERIANRSQTILLDGRTIKECKFLLHSVYEERLGVFNRQPLCAHRVQRDWVLSTAGK